MGVKKKREFLKIPVFFILINKLFGFGISYLFML